MDQDLPHGPDRRPWRDTLSEMAVTEEGEPMIRPPSSDQLQLKSYPEVDGITRELYQLSSSGLTPRQIEQALGETSSLVTQLVKNMLGFQACQTFHYPIFSDLCSVHLSNEGDPFKESKPSISQNTKWLERNILDYYASLWHAKWPHNPSDPDTYWGYINSFGVSESNMFAVATARDYLSGKFSVSSTTGNEGRHEVKSYVQGEFEIQNINADKPVGFYSVDSHFGVSKSFSLCDVPSFHEIGTQLYPNENPIGGPWPIGVPCENGDAGPGSIDIKILATLVDFFSAKGHPIIIVFNYGSTFKGAYDDINSAEEAILPILEKNGVYERKISHPEKKCTITRKGFWFHVDGALACTYMPFIEMGYKQGLIKHKSGPIFDFRLESVSSIATSIAKYHGFSWPCGIYITKTSMQLLLPSHHQQPVSCPTFSCSRNGHTPAMLWSHISSVSFKDEIQKISDMLSVADYAEAKLKDLEKDLNKDLWVSRTRLSLAIYFKQPNKQIFSKYSLSAKSLFFNGELRTYCHIYTMYHVKKESIDVFINDLRMPGAFHA